MRERVNLHDFFIECGIFRAGNWETALERGFEPGISPCSCVERGRVAIRLEPAKGFGAERQDMMAAPESRQELEDEGAEPTLDQFGIRLVTWRLVRDRVGQQSESECRFEGVVSSAHSFCLNLVRP